MKDTALILAVELARGDATTIPEQISPGHSQLHGRLALDAESPSDGAQQPWLQGDCLEAPRPSRL